MELTRLLVLVALSGVAVGVAMLVQRRRPEPPSAPSYRAPTQIDRLDFDGANTKKLIAVFSSQLCDSCAGVWEKIALLETDGVVTQNIEIETDATLHKRYSIDGVPTTILVNSEGVVEVSFFGPLSDLALEELRGSADG